MGTSLSQRWKQWDMKKWAMLTESILKRKIKVVALGSTDERKMIINAFSGVVTIYGPNDDKRSAPLGIKHTIIRKDIPCAVPVIILMEQKR